jgi:hypothetical protein
MTPSKICSGSMPTPLSMPLPPAIPPQSSHNPDLATTANLLDSLVAFYQQERLWVYRTRAALELASYQAPLSKTDGSKNTEPLTPPPSATPVPPTDGGGEGVVKLSPVKSEPTSPESPSTRWDSRKKMFKLKLEGISTTMRRPAQKQREAPHHILTLFGNIMEARMESCQRVNNLIKSANRADLSGIRSRQRH